MEMLESYQIDEEVINAIQSKTEFVWFYSGKAYEEKLYVISNCICSCQEDFICKLKQFLQELPLFVLYRLNITEVVVFANLFFKDFKYESLVIKRYDNKNLSFNITNDKDFHYLALYRNDLVLQ